MKQRTVDNVTGFLAGLLGVLLFFMMFEEASATKKHHNDDNSANAEAAAESASSASATAGDAASDATASASNDGNSLSVGGDSVENNSSNVVLVPNNNTESCVRVFGLAFGKNGESGALGIPWRSAKCDFEQAADDAFAAGERDLGWFWKCQNKNLYKRFKGEGETAEKAIEDCHTRMLATTSTQDVVRKLEERLRAAENLAEARQLDKAVCKESLERCKERAYGGK